MKTIGLLGGMSWESSAQYYNIINREVRAQLGGQHSAKSLLYSVDFHEIQELQHRDKWQELTDLLIGAAREVEAGGADLLLLCTNTMHKIAPEIQNAIGIPLIHIVDSTAKEIKRRNLGTVGLLGTRFTMEGEFYRERLRNIHQINSVIPEENERKTVHKIIYNELTRDQILEESRTAMVEIIGSLVENDAEGIILGCTELPLLIRPGDSPVPILDTTLIHAREAVAIAVEELFE